MPNTIEVPEWWRPGNGMMYRRDALPINHPESTYSYVRREYPDVDPADFGIRTPETVEVTCPKCQCATKHFVSDLLGKSLEHEDEKVSTS